MNTEQQTRKPWYKSPWLGFLLIFPIAAILGCIYMIKIAAANNDGGVADDFSKVGEEVNRNNARDQAALKMGLSGNLLLDADGQHFTLTLNQAVTGTLQLQVLNPTRATLDQKVGLPASSGSTFSGSLPQKLEQPRWTIALGDTGGHWRIQGGLDLKKAASAPLTANSH
ncbi:FixH family protein [Silvimonas sp. JCM 19000]